MSILQPSMEASLDAVLLSRLEGEALATAQQEALPMLSLGLEYGAQFVARLGLGGRRALCIPGGIGFWPLALASRFDEVVAIEGNKHRWRVASALATEASGGRITLTPPAAARLEWPDCHFDAVFMPAHFSTQSPATLAREFERVLVPGGLAYIGHYKREWFERLILCDVADPQRPDHDAALDALQALLIRKLATTSLHIRTLLRESFEYKLRTCDESTDAASTASKEAAEFSWRCATQADPALIEMATAVVERFKKNTYTARQREFDRLLRHVIAGEHIESPPSTLCIEDAANIEAGFAQAGLELLAEHAEGMICADASAPSVGPWRMSEFGVGEMLFIKPNPEISARAILANAETVPSRYSWMRSQTILAVTGRPQGTDITVSEYFQNLSAQLGSRAALPKILDELLEDAPDGEERFLRVYRFIQDALFHHPTVQLVDRTNELGILSDPLAILLAGIGRCGHVSHVATALFELLGHRVRFVKLHKHVAAEVEFEGDWRLIDCDAFKAGVVPRLADGTWPSIDALRADPVRLDATPAIGLLLSSDGKWAKGAFGHVVKGYTDFGLAWDRPYLSHLYFGGPVRYPPRAPMPQAVRIDDRLVLRFDSWPANAENLQVLVGTSPRGWSYDEPPAARWIEPIHSDVAVYVLSRGHVAQDVAIELPKFARHRALAINIIASDSYRVAHPEVIAWPGYEIVLPSASLPATHVPGWVRPISRVLGLSVGRQRMIEDENPLAAPPVASPEKSGHY